MTDYARSKFGHLRPPTWIKNKNDPVWTRAYKLIVFENNSRQDAIEILTASHPTRDRWYFEEMIATILAKSNRSVRAIESQIPIEAIADDNANEDVEPVYESNNKELLEAVIGYLSNDEESMSDAEDFQVKRLMSLLNIELSMSQEDKLLLKMRYCDGMSIAAISKILNLQGDTYKRINKLIKHLSNACIQMGVLESA
jgi:DNA-directed RNA polymerase specialized sigma subunit